MGATRREGKALLEAEAVESGFRNLNYGDRDSLGVLQQRPSAGWHNATNVRGSVRDFLSHARQYRGSGMPAGQLAQAVQRSAFPGRYAEHGSEAQSLLAHRGLTRGGGGGGQVTARLTPFTQSTTRQVQDPAAARRVVLANYLMHTDPGSLLLRSGLVSPDEPTTTTQRVPAQGSMLQFARSAQGGSDRFGNIPKGRVNFAPGADRAGVHTKPVVTRFVSRIAGLARQPLTIGTGSNHSQMTVNGNVSDHWTGHAADIPATGRKLIRLGQDALIAAGMKPVKARKLTGGLYNVPQKDGRRVQVIFNTHEGGDHTNHLHVGISA